jgi:hypothetical protein
MGRYDDVITPADKELVRPFQRIALDLTKPVQPPAQLNRFMYGDGCLTTVQSEPAGGKSWIALALARDQAHEARDVVYLDEENGRDIVTERLIALGGDPAAVAEHFHYFAFESRRWDEEDLVSLDALIASVPHASMAVLDSLPDFISAANKSEDSSTDITWFVNTVLRKFRAAGIPQLLLDHLPKPPTDGKKKQSRYSRGSGAKLAKADATLLLEVAEEFDAEHSGRLHLWKTKDRRGRLNLPSLGKSPLEITVKVGDGTVDITEAETAGTEPWDGPRKCMAVVEEFLRDAYPAEFSGRQLCDKVRLDNPFRNTTITQAAELLAKEGRIKVRHGARNASLYSYQESIQ